MSSLIARENLSKSTKSLNQAIERMTTGYKINRAADNAAGYAIAKDWETKISALDVAADNAATATDMLTVLEDTYSLVSSHIQRVRDLTEQAANGTYGEQSKEAIKAEIEARLQEINRITANCEFSSNKLMDGSMSGIAIQVGIDSSADSRIELIDELFGPADVTSLCGISGMDVDTLAKQCAGLVDVDDKRATDMLTVLDTMAGKITSRVTTLGAASNRLESAIEAITVQQDNLTSSLSTLRDADVAVESSEYIKAQILQQASATLLSSANQVPSIALNLL